MIRVHQVKEFLGLASLFVVMCIVMSVAEAETETEAIQSHKSIYKAAKGFVRGHVASLHKQAVEIKVGKLDSRLRLRQCDSAIEAFLPKGSRDIGKTTVGVKCTGSKPWSLHVPVTISVFKNVLVAARTLQKAAILTEADIKLVRHDLSSLAYGYYEDKKSGSGMKLKRRVVAGAVLTPAMLKKPRIITRGQKVAIMAQSGRMQIRMMGKALDSGALGDRIKVLNVKSKQKLEGTVTSSSVVEVDI